MKLELNEPNLAMLKFGTVLQEGNTKYYFLPFWFEQTDDEAEVEVHRLGNLPKRLNLLINEHRGIDGE